ncbi:MAG: hypothetical protein ACLTDY_04760 [Dialister invisus]
MTENERRHSERQRRIYDRGGESGKKIKAISYQLKVLNDGGRSGVSPGAMTKACCRDEEDHKTSS